MKLGAFSISLNVKDVEKSRDFYRHLGFGDFGGDASQGWLILKNGDTVLGLFGGFIGQNTLTFNPGWDQRAQSVDPFDDVRVIQARLLEAGITIKDQTDPNGTGPGSISLLDPDGNAILIDQHR